MLESYALDVMPEKGEFRQVLLFYWDPGVMLER